VLADQRREQDAELDGLHRRIEKWLGPMLADMILPTPRDVSGLLGVLADRYALDFAGLPDSCTSRARPDAPAGEVNWFRTLTEPDGSLLFERFRPGAAVAGLLGEDDTRPMNKRLTSGVDWRALAREVLPVRLEEILAGGEAELVISPHGRLCLLPWAALTIDDAGTRLVERAVIGQTPVLSCLAGATPPAVAEPALVRLVAEPGGIWADEESEAWGLSAESLHAVCAVPPGDAPRTVSAALTGRDRRWRFLHVAAHGGGSGLEQYLRLPEEQALGGRLTAAHALGLHWPESTLMASCKVGRLVNVEDDELLGFVMAVLAGGGHCVVAAIDTVGDLSAGWMAGAVVKLVRSQVTLAHALRAAQLDSAQDPEAGWALFNAYVR
jgi:hypothetical protein